MLWNLLSSRYCWRLLAVALLVVLVLLLLMLLLLRVVSME